MTIAAILEGQDREIISCTPQDSVQTAAGRLATNRIGCLPVLDHGEVVGIFSERDLLYSVAKTGERALERPVSDVMTAPALTIEKSTTVLNAVALMTRRRVRHLPVMEEGRLIGFISIGDLVKYRIDQIENEAQAMRDYIATA